MNNNNPNVKSPLDEIKRITKDAVPNNQRRRPSSAASVQRTPAPAPAPQPKKPAPMPDSDVAKKVSTPVTPKAPSAMPAANNSDTTRIPQVKAAPAVNKKPAPASVNDNSKTRITDAVPAAAPNKSSAAKVDENSKTRITNAVPVSASKKSTTATKPTAKKTESVKKAPKSTKPSAPKKPAKEESGKGGILSNTVKAIIYIVSVFVISGCLSMFVIFVGNDCFAFVKPDTEVEVTIPRGSDLADIAEILHDNDIIKYPSMFKLYVNLRNKDTDTYLSGKFTVKAAMSYDTLIAKFKPYSTREEVTITIVEGSTTQEIIDLFVNQGIGTQEGFEKAINEYEYDFWFLEDLTKDQTSDRIYRLDGYLFPDTYNFFTDSKEEDIIYKLLDNFDKKFDKDNIARLEELGMTLDDIVILASMIQSEAKYVSNNPYADNGSDYALVSAVFHNRLNNPDYNSIGGKLQSDATVKYVLDFYGEDIDLATALKTYETPYNTYLNAGLPAGPISNPSLNAINFAMNPDLITGKNYYYFISNSQGYNYYASTSAEHAANVEKVKSESTEN